MKAHRWPLGPCLLYSIQLYRILPKRGKSMNSYVTQLMGPETISLIGGFSFLPARQYRVPWSGVPLYDHLTATVESRLCLERHQR